MRFWFLGIALSWLIAGTAALGDPVPAKPKTANAKTTDGELTIPTIRFQLGTDQANIPDWHKISFASLPPLAESGSVGELHWQAGDHLENLLTLSDFQDTFRLQNLDFYAILLSIQRDPKTISLAQFKLINQQTLANLVAAVPDLGKLPVSSVQPIEDLLRSAKPDYQLDQLTPLSVVVQDPTLGTLTFNHFDLSPYNLTDIPGLIQTPFIAFVGWQNARIRDIPGLMQMPWSQFVPLPDPTALIGIAQLPDADEPSGPPISGSTRQGFHIDCPTQNCPSISFTDNDDIEGKRWIAGNVQQVLGGTGDLAQQNRGLEPTGRYPYGTGFKLVLTQIDPEHIQSALYFEHCQRTSLLVPTSCSPYAIGPIPFQSFRPGDPMLVGEVDASVPDAPDASIDFTPSPPPAASLTPASEPFWQGWLSLIVHLLGFTR